MGEWRRTVAGIVYQDNEFFIVKKAHWGDWWDYIQGKVEESEETLENCLKKQALKIMRCQSIQE